MAKGGMHGIHAPPLRDTASQCTGGMHPTGIHSCFIIIRSNIDHFSGNFTVFACVLQQRNIYFKHLPFEFLTFFSCTKFFYDSFELSGSSRIKCSCFFLREKTAVTITITL